MKTTKEALLAPINVKDAFIVGLGAVATVNWLGRRKEREQAQTDPLTGLLNRRGFEKRFAELKNPAALVYFDLTNFKSVNDKFGHARGDEVILDASAKIKESLRPESGDLLARVGGDEFVAVLSPESRWDKERGGVEIRQPEEILGHVLSRFETSAALFREDNKDVVTGYGVDIAFGGIICEPNTSFAELHETIKAAEAKMLEHKAMQHETNGVYRPSPS